MAVVYPRGLLAILAAVLGTAATTTLGKLSLEFLPFAALVVRTLADATARLVLAAEIPHHHTCPVLHVLRVVTDSELLNQGKDVHIIWKKVFILLWLLDRRGAGVIQHVEFTVNLELWNKVRMLEEGPEVAVLGYVGQKLKRHQNVFITRHCRQHTLSRGRCSIAVVESIGARNDGRRVVVGVPGRRQAQGTVGLRRVVVNRATVNS